jgi:hypothetical protein
LADELCVFPPLIKYIYPWRVLLVSCLRILIITGNGAEVNYLMDMLVDLVLGVVKFLRRFQYGFYEIFFTGYFFLEFVLLDSFYLEKVQDT